MLEIIKNIKKRKLFIQFGFKCAITRYIGNMVRIYRGILDKVPVKVGIITENHEKMSKDFLIFNLCPINKEIIVPRVDNNSTRGIQNASVL
jgi:hypothetical protein